MSFSGTGVLGLKSRFLESLFLHPNKIKIRKTVFDKRNLDLACGKVMPNTYIVVLYTSFFFFFFLSISYGMNERQLDILNM